MSAQQGSTAVMRLLLAAGTNGQTVCVRLLLGASANVNTRGNGSDTALYWASEFGHVACVRLLLRYGRADMSLRGDVPYNKLARDNICQHPLANKAASLVIRGHFDTAERWEREREAAMRDGVATRSRRRTLRPLRRIYGAIPEHLLSK